MNYSTLTRILFVGGLVCGASAWGITPTDLQAALAANEHITVIDVRPTGFFQKGHIPEAINVPASILSEKKLPRLGRVVVYDGGLGDDLAACAVAALNAKPGISAEALDGGFAGWEAAKGQSTAEPGLSNDGPPQITYKQLKTASSDNVVLVDLRTPVTVTAGRAAKSSGPPLTDLQAEFPKARVTQSPFDVPVVRTKSAGSIPPLLVLIDRGDGTAQKMARTLKANGVTRFVILVGGEETLVRKGQPGLQRAGSTIVVRSPQP